MNKAQPVIVKNEIKSCCGKKQLVWKLPFSIQKEYLGQLQKAGFPYLKSFYDAGMLYLENKTIIVTGVFGLNEIKIKCKHKDCSANINLLEHVLLHLE